MRSRLRNLPHIPVLQQLSVALAILALVFGTTYIGEIAALINGPVSEEPHAAQADASVRTHTTIIEEDPFEGILIDAKAAYVWDVRAQKALYNKNADMQLPLASITKLMTALVAYELFDQGESINISIDAIEQEGDSGLSDGEVFSIRNLTDLVLVSSSNDGAYALAAAGGAVLGDSENSAATFVSAMNIKAEALGLSQTYFHNPTGLDLSETEGGAFGSARDVAFLMEYMLTTYPEVLELTREDRAEVKNALGETYVAENTNPEVSGIKGLIASKTGYTDLAGGNLVVAFDAGLNRPIIISVLGSTAGGRFSDTAALAEAAQRLISSE